MQIEFTGLPVF